MNLPNHSDPSVNPLPQAAKGIARKTAAATKDITDAVEDIGEDIADAGKSTAQYAADKARALYQSAAERADESLATSREYVCRNPVPVVLGAFAFGAALGCLLMLARRKPTFSERYAEEPLVAVREAILGALAPVTQRVHQGYDSARDGAGKVIDRVQNIGSERTCDSFTDQIGRIGNNLKFW